jgi:hypothetical protein
MADRVTLPVPGAIDLDNWAIPLTEAVNEHDESFVPAWQAYTPTWASSGTQPAIGNGVITGRYVQTGKIVRVSVRILMGSTTTYGTGTYSISLPVNAAQVAVGSSYLRDSSAGSTGHLVGNAVIDPALNVGVINLFNVNAQVAATSPFTWANTDHMSFSVVYESV